MNHPVPDIDQLDAEKLTEVQAFWFAHVQRCHDSGLSMAAYARQHQLSDKSLYHWVKRRREWKAEPSIVGAASLHRVRISSATEAIPSDRLAVWLRLPNGIECELRHVAVGHCIDVLTGLSRLPT